MNTHLDTLAASATSEHIDSAEQKVTCARGSRCCGLFAEVDAILCAALAPVRFRRRHQSPDVLSLGPGRPAGPVGHWSERGEDQYTRPRRPTRPSD